MIFRRFSCCAHIRIPYIHIAYICFVRAQFPVNSNIHALCAHRSLFVFCNSRSQKEQNNNWNFCNVKTHRNVDGIDLTYRYNARNFTFTKLLYCICTYALHTKHSEFSTLRLPSKLPKNLYNFFFRSCWFFFSLFSFPSHLWFFLL